MILRLWRTKVEPHRLGEYERFAREVSLPMFKSQPGFRQVLFARSGDECLVVTLWEDKEAVAALATWASYQNTVAKIQGTGFLIGEAATEVFTVHGGAG